MIDKQTLKWSMSIDEAKRLVQGTNLWVEGDRKQGTWVWRVWHIADTREDSKLILTTESDVMLTGFILGFKNCLRHVNKVAV